MEDAAIGLFATRGLAGTTIKDIATQAGVTEGALYRHYAGKNEMAWQLYCREVRAFTSQMSPILAKPGATLAERLTEGVKFIYQYYRKQPDSLVFVLLTRQSFPSQYLTDAGIDPDGMIVGFLQSEMTGRAITKADATLLMALVRGAVLEPIYMHRYGKLKTHPTKLAGQVAAACLRILGIEE